MHCECRKVILQGLRRLGCKVQPGRAPPSALERAAQTRLQKLLAGKAESTVTGTSTKPSLAL